MKKRKPIDYGYKAEVIATGLPVIVDKINRIYYAYSKAVSGDFSVANYVSGKPTPYTQFDFDEALNLQKVLVDTDLKAYLEAEKINHADHARTKRLRDRVSLMLLFYGSVSFVTLTFRDEVLEKTNDLTRKRYVERFLKSQAQTYAGCDGMYIANKDFGKENGREHYHALISGRINLKEWDYGFIFAEQVRVNPNKPDKTEKHCRKLSKYIAKLTNHAIKSTTKRSPLMYSKLPRQWLTG